jgi:hypothetical protein
VLKKTLFIQKLWSKRYEYLEFVVLMVVVVDVEAKEKFD